MAELVPAIHAAPFPDNLRVYWRLDDADDRDKPGHDGDAVVMLAQRASRR